MLQHSTRRLVAYLLAVTFSFSLVPAAVTSEVVAGQQSMSAEMGQEKNEHQRAAQEGVNQARTALTKGKDLLRHNRADKALVLFETALQSFIQAGDQRGEAATRDALGDLYTRQGQYRVALLEYQSALKVFRAESGRDNANVVLAKMGDLNYLMGNTPDAGAMFVQIDITDKRDTGVAFVNARGEPTSASARAVNASILHGAAAAACFSVVNGGASDSQSEPSNMGHAPNVPDGIGRADLRVVDQAGNPVNGVQAKLESKRPNHFTCQTWSATDTFGRAVLPPLHVGQLKLSVKAAGYQSLTAVLGPEQLAQPVRVQLARAGTQGLSRLIEVLAVAAPAGCFQLYRSFISYVRSEYGSGRIAYMSGQLEQANEHFARVLAAADPNTPVGQLAQAHKFRAAALTSLGDIAARRGEQQEALRLYTAATDGARNDLRPDLMWAAQRGTGKALWTLAAQQTEPRQAAKLQADSLQAYRESLNTIETLLAGGIRSDEARTTFLATTEDVFDETASALAELALTSAPTAALKGNALTYAAEAFKVVEQGRARSLLELLGESRAEITEGMPAALLTSKADNLARQQEIAEQLTDVSLGVVLPTGTIRALEAELDRLEVTYASLENRLRTSSPRYATLTKSQPLTLAEVQQRVLDDETALLEYSLGDKRSYLWAVTRTGARLYPLPGRSTMESLVADFRAATVASRHSSSVIEIGSPNNGTVLGGGRSLSAQAATIASVDAFTAAALRLYRAAVEPTAPFVGEKRLLIVADGALNYVPFEALITKREGSSYDVLPYLVKTNEIVYAPSASVIAATRRQVSNANAGRGLLLVADPVFDASDPRGKQVLTNAPPPRDIRRGLTLSSPLEDVTQPTAGGLKLPRLPGTRMEAEQVNALARSLGYQTDVWLDLAASETNVRDHDLSQYRVVHFATHGLLNTDRPQFTGLALSLIGEGENDGFLRTGEVFNLRLGTPLVMLSACETGLGKLQRGEGVIGLTRGFMYAGAPTVGVSLWAVADNSTAELMTGFYRYLLEGAGTHAPTALRAAQQDMISGKRLSAPYYWAPFVLIGDWR
jgi:CHAT domain-containing protein/tetratricopeptide (TPR) repeat protein